MHAALPHLLEARSPTVEVSQGWFLLRPLSLACRQRLTQAVSCLSSFSEDTSVLGLGTM